MRLYYKSVLEVVRREKPEIMPVFLTGPPFPDGSLSLQSSHEVGIRFKGTWDEFHSGYNEFKTEGTVEHQSSAEVTHRAQTSLVSFNIK